MAFFFKKKDQSRGSLKKNFIQKFNLKNKLMPAIKVPE